MDLNDILQNLLSLEAENEIVEFKEAKMGYDFNKLGKYFSALSNEANLNKKDCAWLVFGIKDKDKAIIGSQYRPKRADLDSLKKEIADKTTNRLTFIEIFEINHENGRIILFQIPAALRGIPIAFEGHYYGREGESLSPLNLDEIERIRIQNTNLDWSAQIVEDATLEDIDDAAIAKARIEFKKRNPKYKEEVDNWADAKFLDKAKITIKGKITNTALVLLGKEESAHFLGSSVKIRWLLRTANNQDRDFEIFSTPFLLNVEAVCVKIRNLKYQYLREGTMFPDEFLRYAPFTLREPLHNAIAHQDYTKSGYINVVEFEDDRLVFSNYGKFLPQSLERVVLNDTPEETYRNPFLVEAMKNLDMVETQGGGIRKLFNFQRERFFPMPEYDFTEGKTKVTIIGKILDVEFARILANNPALDLDDILILDKAQKKKNITDNEYKYLKKMKFIEGRKPNIFLSFKVIEPTNNEDLMAEYIANKSFDDQHFKDMIIKYLSVFTAAKRTAFDKLLMPKLSNTLTEEQKKKKVSNFLTALRIENKIECNADADWKLKNI